MNDRTAEKVVDMPLSVEAILCEHRTRRFIHGDSGCAKCQAECLHQFDRYGRCTNCGKEGWWGPRTVGSL